MGCSVCGIFIKFLSYNKNIDKYTWINFVWRAKNKLVYEKKLSFNHSTCL